MTNQTQQLSLQIGDVAPDFVAQTTDGLLYFHQWLGNSWCVFFSHPKDFTPVCTTELGLASRLKSQFEKRKVKLIALSVGSVVDHSEWTKDINETQHTSVNFPLIGDENGQIANLYGMIHPKANDTFTVRTVFIIDPSKKIRLMMTYPASTGRNFTEILRVIDSMQLTDNHSVATPADWKWGDECVILPSVTDQNTLKKLFPNGYRQIKPYLRMTPQPGVGQES
ncbi:peroxidase [Candidatus Protochlamydia naegleriophila]|uniref:Thioredoxin peroxidase n=1 Tax=Candidatus Protochlamydia naegleriophila TaxID=389348 RepID=A0A0U5ERB3_9BACT|nr:peroxiredoxin [Candidatus Protochlamydia naegleriophila]CUI16723.1 peroxidase [Candidatus Protochlamydia naegleriophila]